MKINKMTMEEIRAKHPDTYINTFDAGSQYDERAEENVRALDVIVWPDYEMSLDDDGANAIARYLIRA